MDINYRRIPNYLTFTLMITGLAYNTLGGPGWYFSLCGILTGLVLLLLPYWLCGMGAGDVKLMMGVGSVIGYQYALYIGVMAGVIAALYVTMVFLVKGKLGELLQTSADQAVYLLSKVSIKDYKTEAIGTGKNLPFAVPITISTLTVLLWRWWQSSGL